MQPNSQWLVFPFFFYWGNYVTIVLATGSATNQVFPGFPGSTQTAAQRLHLWTLHEIAAYARQ